MKISIIVPIYNRAQFLPKCLDSIATQSFADWECLLIDDGSTDNGLAICQAYASKDERFKVFHQENRGVSSARNLGLGQVQGESVCFVDSDDYLHEDCLSSLYEAIGSSGLCCGGLTVRGEDGAVVYISNFPSCVLSFREDSQRSVFLDLDHTCLLNGPCNKLYRRSILEKHSIRFCENLSLGEDRQLNFDYLLHIDTITVVDNCFYNVIGTYNSLSRSCECLPWERYRLAWDALYLFCQKIGWNEREVWEHLGNSYCDIALAYKDKITNRSTRMSYLERFACASNLYKGNGRRYLKYANKYSVLWRIILRYRYLFWIAFVIDFLRDIRVIRGPRSIK